MIIRPVLRRSAAGVLLLLAAGASALHAQGPGPGRLTVERVFSPEFYGDPFGPVKWLGDGSGYTTLEPAAEGAGRDIVRYDARTGQRSVLVAARRLVPEGSDGPLAVSGYDWSADGKKLLVFTNTARVWRYHTRGDYWVLDLESGRLRRLGGPEAAPSTLMFAKFSPDSRRVGYVREHDVYVEELETGRVVPLTADGSRTTINGTFDWVYEEELDLRDGWRWSPDGKRIAYWQLDATGVRDFLLVNNTDSIYSFVVPVQFPKAGTTNSAARVGVVSAEGGPTTWLELPGDPRNHYPARMDWAASSDEVLVQQLNRRQNTNRVFLAAAASGSVREVLTERDSAWLDPVDDLVWLDGGRRFTWISERDGWRHVYVASRDGRELRQATRGSYDVWSIQRIDDREGWIYFVASPGNPTQRYLYRARLDGRGAPQRLSPEGQPGTHSYGVSPDARWAIHSYSRFGTPSTVELVELPGHRVARTLVGNERQKRAVAALERGEVEFFRVPNGEGTELDGYLMKPPGFDPARRYPILFFTYGEPAQSTVRDWWEGSAYLWHLMLTQRGYLVASIDNRGAPAPRGRAFRKAIYKQLGVVNANDQAAGARALLRRPYVDGDRAAVWGWSGGGAMTLNLLFRHPGLFGTGMAVSPVTDLHYYDTIYQERYTGLPQEDSAAYRTGSPVNFVEGLRANLLLVHGSGDDNVHYQNSQALVNALVAANKPFDFMEYPNRTHCICEGEGTTEHLYNLLTRYLNDHVPAGAR
ncbi:MAG TPA: S9 family peptidase [Longimicrobiaceae bacterium]|nr:S9 family peptidase [Longimicrobiaceae bacterium]